MREQRVDHTGRARVERVVVAELRDEARRPASSPVSDRARSSRSRVRAGPSCPTSTETLLTDRQLPSVRAIGTPNRADRVATRRSHTAARASPPPMQ